MQEWPGSCLFTSFTCCASRLLVSHSTHSIVTGNFFLAGLWRALRLPGHIENMGMRQDHTTRPGEQREVDIGIDTAGRSEPAAVVNYMIANAVRFVFSNSEIVNGSCIVMVSDVTNREVEILFIGEYISTDLLIARH